MHLQFFDFSMFLFVMIRLGLRGYDKIRIERVSTSEVITIFEEDKIKINSHYFRGGMEDVFHIALDI